MSKRFSILLSIAILLLGSQFYACTDSSTSTPNNTESTTTESATTSETVKTALNDYTFSLTDKLLPGDEPISINQVELMSLKASITSLKRQNSPKAIGNIRKLFYTANNANAKELAGWWLARHYLQEGDLDNTKATLGIIQSNANYASSAKAKELLGQM